MGKPEKNNYRICKIDSRNRISIPPEVMEKLNLESGNHISIEEHDGQLCIFKAYFGVRRNGISRGDGGNKKTCTYPLSTPQTKKEN